MKQLNDEKSIREAANKEKDDLKERNLELEKEKNDEKSMKNKYKKEKNNLKEWNLELERKKNDEIYMKNKNKKEKEDILFFLEREVTCPVCLMVHKN